MCGRYLPGELVVHLPTYHICLLGNQLKSQNLFQKTLTDEDVKRVIVEVIVPLVIVRVEGLQPLISPTHLPPYPAGPKASGSAAFTQLTIPHGHSARRRHRSGQYWFQSGVDSEGRSETGTARLGGTLRIENVSFVTSCAHSPSRPS